MTFDPAAFLRAFRKLDRRLAAHGVPATSPWWLSQTERFVHALAAGVRQWVVRAGRRGGKSLHWCRLAVAWALFGAWAVPTGDVAVIAFVSITRDEATQRLRTIATMLDALGVAYERRSDAIELTDRRCAFRVYTASWQTAVGFTAILVIGDECARWESREDSSNPASHVFQTLRPTLATQPFGFMVLSSSPWGRDDYHAESFARGDGAGQIVSYAPSWLANPTLTESSTRVYEPDERAWRREYLAEPQDAALAAFPADAIESAFTHAREYESCGALSLICDPSSGRKDSWTWMVASWAMPKIERPSPLMIKRYYQEGTRWVDGIPWTDGAWVDDYYTQLPNGELVRWKPKAAEPFVLVHQIDGIEGRFFNQIHADEIVAQLATLCRRNGIRDIHGDQREAYTLSSMFSRRGLRYHVHDWTSASKPPAVAQLRRLVAEHRLALPQHPTLKRELHSFEERITPSGQLTFGARGSGHDDYVSCLVTMCMADLSGSLRDSPFGVDRSVHLANHVPGARAG